MLITTYEPNFNSNIKHVPEPLIKVKKIVKFYKENTNKRKNKEAIFIDTYA